MIKSLIISLILTIVLEIVLSYILGIRNLKDFKIIIFSNIYTNPIVVFLANIVYWANNGMVYFCSVFILEIGAIIIEALLYKEYLKTFKKPIRLSIYNNIFSFVIGAIILSIYKGGII